MDQRVSLITLAVGDLRATREFYCDGLGWEPVVDTPGEVLMFQVAERVVLSFWDEHAFADEVGSRPVRGGMPPVVLAHNVETQTGVDRVLEQARLAGADPVTEAQEREWGGYSGYFADPDGYRWEVAMNPGELGQLLLG